MKFEEAKKLTKGSVVRVKLTGKPLHVVDVKVQLKDLSWGYPKDACYLLLEDGNWFHHKEVE